MKVMKVFDVLEMSKDLREETFQWLTDLNRTAIEHTVYLAEAEHGDKLDKYLMSNGAKDLESVMIYADW